MRVFIPLEYLRSQEARNTLWFTVINKSYKNSVGSQTGHTHASRAHMWWSFMPTSADSKCNLWQLGLTLNSLGSRVIIYVTVKSQTQMLCKPTYYTPLNFRPLGQIRVFKVHHLTMFIA